MFSHVIRKDFSFINIFSNIFSKSFMNLSFILDVYCNLNLLVFMVFTIVNLLVFTIVYGNNEIVPYIDMDIYIRYSYLILSAHFTELTN